MSATWLKSPAAVFTASDENAGGGLVVSGSRIIELVSAGAKPECEYSATVDLDGRVVLPGLINTHHHFYQTLTRALPTALNKPLFPWLQALYLVWQNLD